MKRMELWQAGSKVCELGLWRCRYETFCVQGLRGSVPETWLSEQDRDLLDPAGLAAWVVHFTSEDRMALYLLVL